MTLAHIVQQQSTKIVDEAVEGLQRAHLTGYSQAGPDVTRQRLESLLGIVTEAIGTHDLGHMLAHAETIAHERYEGGYDLSEVQTAFNVLEEVLWKHIIGQLAPDQQADALGLVSTILGEGKDSLARCYVSLATRTHAPALNVQNLFRGQ